MGKFDQVGRGKGGAEKTAVEVGVEVAEVWWVVRDVQ